MNKLTFVAKFFMIAVLFFGLAACSQDKGQAAGDKDARGSMKTVSLDVQGMSCGNCVNSINEALADLDGVSSKTVSLDDNSCTVNYDASQTNQDEIIAAIESLDYTVQMKN